MSDVSVQVGSKSFDLWKTVRITRSLETLSGSWELTAAGRPAMRPGDDVIVALAGTRVLTGFIDDVSWQIDAKSQSVTVSGRDRTADLVDCSVVGARQYSQITLMALAQQLTKPFGITVVGATGGQFDSLTLQPEETVFSALERAARMRGYLLTSNERGELVLARPRTTGVASVLTLGDNLLSAMTSVSMREPHSRYIVQSQTLEDTVGQSSTTETDAEVKRYRPLVIASQQGDDPRTRARWTRQVRRARGTRVNCAVYGWLNGKELWSPNQMVRIVTPDITMDLLVVGTTFSRDEQGTRTELECVRPGAYDPEPEPAPHREDNL